MKTIYIEGPLEALRAARRVAGVRYAESGVSSLGGNRYRLGADIDDDDAIGAIEALGCNVRVAASDADFERLFAEHERKRREGGS